MRNMHSTLKTQKKQIKEIAVAPPKHDSSTTIDESEDTSDNNTNLENETIDEIENLSESVVDNFDFD